MVGIGKLGTIYLVNRDAMGGFNAGDGSDGAGSARRSRRDVQHARVLGRERCQRPACSNMIYTIGVGDQPKMFVISNGMIKTPAASIGQASRLDFPARRR